MPDQFTRLSEDERRAAECVQATLTADASGINGALSDVELARNFSQRYASSFRYCASFARWYVWSGAHWSADTTRAVEDAARRSCALDLGFMLLADLTEPQRRALRIRLGSAATIQAVVRLAAADRCHAVTVNCFDADPWSLNTTGGVIDLRTGRLQPHSSEQLNTKITALSLTTECPLFLATLERVLPDPEVRGYLQRLAGYCLTGVIREHVIVLVQGGGGNGKSVVFNAIAHALGSYAVTLGAETLQEAHHDRHPTEIAVLNGARLALCPEIDGGRRWNIARLKRLSGGDPLTARLIAKDPFEFLPSHKLVVIANASPALSVVDEAVRRRFHKLEFNVTIPQNERDPDLPEKLKAEAGGIIRWMLAGCLDWQDGGLRPPKAVVEATDAFLDREDTIGEWIRECCRPMGQSTLTELYQSYRAWMERQGLVAVGRNTLGSLLESRGVVRQQTRPKVWHFIGISVVSKKEMSRVG